MTETKTHEIIVAHSLPEVTDLSAQAYGNELPGFQVHEQLARQAGLLAVMDSIEEGSEATLGVRVPFTHEPGLWNEPGRYAPHIDSSFRGLAIHDNHSGEGKVQLAHLLDGTQPGATGAKSFMPPETDYRFYNGNGIQEEDVDRGPIYEGLLVPHRLTVFSQGNIDGLRPTVHFFKRTGGGNWWTRYASDFRDAELAQPDLIDKAEQFRLNFLRGEYYQLESDARQISSMRKNFPDHNADDPELTGSGLTEEEIKAALRKHPGKNIIHQKTKPGEYPKVHKVSSARRILHFAANDVKRFVDRRR